MHNGIHIAVVIAFLHDIADIFVNLLKFFAESKYGNLAAGLFAIHLFTWGYTRNYLFFFYIRDLVIKPVPGMDEISLFI